MGSTTIGARSAAAALLALAALSGCGGEEAAVGSPVTDPGDDPNRLQLRAATDDLAYVPEELTAQGGQVFSIRFSNDSDQDHSWALVRAGDEAALDAAESSGEQGSAVDKTVDPVPPGRASTPSTVPGEVLADSGGPVRPGEARLVQVEALAPGTYTYLCTLDGHADEGMRGVLRVER